MTDFQIAPTTHQPVTATRQPFSRVRVAAVVVLVLLAGEVGARALPDELVAEQAWPTTHAAVVRELETAAATTGVDVAFVGASHVVRAVDPVAVGEALGGTTVVNAGILAAPPTETADWTREVVLPTAAPDVLVVAVTPAELGSRLVLRAPNLHTSSGYRRAAGEPNLLDRIETVSDLAQARTLLRTPWTAVQRVRLWGELRDERGTRGRFSFLPDEQPDRAAWRAGYERFAIVDESGTDALRTIIQAARASGTEVVLLSPPIESDILATVAPDGAPSMGELERRLVALCEEYDVPMLDLSTPPPSHLMLDPVHVTEAGRDWVTPQVVAGLRDLGVGS